MLIRLPKASGGQEYKARDWFVSLTREFREALDAGVRQCERVLGSCEIFVEGHILGFQIDLLFAFPSHVAVCEIKNHWDHSLNGKWQSVCGHGAKQASDAADVIRRHLGQHGRNKGTYPFLFFPNALPTKLQEMDTWLASTDLPHTRLCGVFTTAIGRRTQSLYLQHQLAAIEPRDKLDIANADERIRRLYFESSIGRRWHNFCSFVELGEYLATLPPRRIDIARNKWHVAEIRREECDRAFEILRQHRIVELVGAPGLGKTSLAGDILESLAAESHDGDGEPWEFHRIALSGCKDATAVKRILFTEIGLVGKLEEALAGLLASRSAIVIYDRDEASHIGLRELLEEIEGRPGRCLWIIESHVALCPKRYCLELKPMSVNDLTRILRIEIPGTPGRDAEQIAAQAGGNPRVARSMWVSTTETQARPNSDSVRWFVETLLSADEREILQALVYLMHLSPLGLPIAHLQEWLNKACPQVPNGQRRDAALASLLVKLRHAQFARIDSVPAPIVAALGLAARSEDVLLSVDQALVSKFVREERVGSYKHLLANSQLDWWDKEDDVVGISAQLLDDNLDAFLRSTYRRTHLGEVLTWLGQREFASNLVDPRLAPQREAYKALKLLEEVSQRNAPQMQTVTAAFHSDRAHDPKIVHYARRVLEGHVIATQPGGGDELAWWMGECQKETNVNLRAEMLIRLSVGHQRIGDSASIRKAWQILQEAHQLSPQLQPAACSLVEEFVLGFLNRTKVQIPEIPERMEKRIAIIASHARNLLEIALGLGNVSLAAAAVYYYVRAEEYLLAHEGSGGEAEYRRLLSYLPALEFVERVSGKHRLQAVLTQGSIHRHVARLESAGSAQLGHAARAVVLYERALHGALLRRHWGWAIDAVAYMAEVCLKEIRNPFDSYDASAVRQVVSHCSRIARGATRLQQELHRIRPQLLSKENATLQQIKADQVLLGLVEMAAAPIREDLVGDTVAGLTELTDSLQSLLRPRQPKELNMRLRDLHRALRFAWSLLEKNQNTAASVRDPYGLGKKSRQTMKLFLSKMERPLLSGNDSKLSGRYRALTQLLDEYARLDQQRPNSGRPHP